MQKLIWQNADGEEVNLTGGNYGITAWEGFSNTSLNIQSQQVPFQDGGVFLDALLEQRELSVTLAINDGNNLETRYRLRRELIHSLNPKLGEGYLIYTNDFTSKRIKCVPQIPLFETHNSNDSGTPKASLSWTACEPYWEDLNETEISISTGEVKNIKNESDIDIGIKLEIKGSSKNPTLINLTEKKEIQIQGVQNNDIYIDTNFGQKKVEKKEYDFSVEERAFLTSISSNGDKLFAVGQQNAIQINEYNEVKDISLIFDNLLTGVVCGDNKIVIYSGSNFYISINNGQGWTKKSNFPAGYAIICTMYINEMFYIVCNRENMSYLFKTEDFENYTQIWSDNNFYYNHKAVYANGIILISARISGSASSVLLKSVDGENFTKTEFTNLVFIGITFTNEEFYICTPNSVYKTLDGENITLISQNKFTSANAFLFYKNYFYLIAVSISSYKKQILKSIDCVYWEENIEQPLISQAYALCVYKNSIYYVGEGGYIGSTEDGLEKNTIKTPSIFSDYVLGLRNPSVLNINNDIYFGVQNYICCVKENGEIEQTNVPASQGNLVRLAYGNGVFLFILVGDNKVYVFDLAEKTYSLVITAEQNLYNIKFENGAFYILGNNIIKRSYNGINFEDITPSSESDIQYEDIAYGNGCYVICKNYGNLISTRDFLAFTEHNISTKAVAFGNGCFVTKGWISVDGFNWKTGSQDISNTNISYVNNLFISIMPQGVLKKSYNGTSWEEDLLKCRIDSSACTYKSGEYIIIGGSNKVLYVKGVADEVINIIQYLSPNSDMELKLRIGDNKLKVTTDEGEALVTVKYRQKYLGV